MTISIPLEALVALLTGMVGVLFWLFNVWMQSKNALSWCRRLEHQINSNANDGKIVEEKIFKAIEDLRSPISKLSIDMATLIERIKHTASS